MRGSLPDLSKLVSTLQAHGQNIADELAVRLQAVAPVGETGDFQASLHGEVDATDSGMTLRVVSDDPKAAVVIEPTKPHEIEGNPLHWTDSQGDHFARRVHHPGTVGWGVKVESLQEALAAEVEDGLRLAIDEALGS